MLIARNTREFKAVKEIIDELSADRVKKRKVQLFIVKPGAGLDSRIPIDSLGKDSDIHFRMNFERVEEYLRNYEYQLHRSDSREGLYFFKRSNAKHWDQNPFSFSPAIRKKLEPFLKVPGIRKKTELKVIHSSKKKKRVNHKKLPGKRV